ncbi:MAG: rod shape-determining protein MreC [Truepera sp.]|nr:rod shape-determining protein MreC [Truepera sp.]
MSNLLKAWYLFLGLTLLTFVAVAFVGTPPSALSSAVALPHQLPYRLSLNVRQISEAVLDRRELRSTISRLERTVAELEAENRRLRVTEETLRSILTVRQMQSPGAVLSVPVTGVDPSPVRSRLTLGAGSHDGVRRNMPVTVPNGLVGIVTETTPGSAMVRTIIDPESQIGVTVRGVDGQTRGGQGVAIGEVSGLLRVIYSERDPIQLGDFVETSSRGGLFPRGILVGVIVRVEPHDPNSLQTTFMVQPAVDLSLLDEVSLIEPL